MSRSQNDQTGLDQESLRACLQRWHQENGRGSWKMLGGLTGLDAGGLARISKGHREASLSTWLKLHQALPGVFPPPVTSAANLACQHSAWARIQNAESLRPSTHRSGDARIETSQVTVNPFLPPDIQDNNYQAFEGKISPENQKNAEPLRFFVEDDSLSPLIIPGDTLLADPRQEVAPGSLCLAFWSDSPLKLARRYHKIEGMDILLADNPAYPPVVLGNDKKRVVLKRVIQLLRFF